MSKYLKSENKSEPATGFAYTDQDYAQFEKLMPTAVSQNPSTSKRKSNATQVNEGAFAYTQQDVVAFEKLSSGSVSNERLAEKNNDTHVADKPRIGIRSSIAADRIRVVELDKFSASKKENGRAG